MFKDFISKIEKKEIVCGILGLGYVGLPLGVEFAKSKVKVIGYDVNPAKVKSLNALTSYVIDIPDSDLVKTKKYFRATNNVKDLQKADAIFICVPTPLRKTKDPDISYILSALNLIKSIDYSGKFIVLESTTYPGTTDEILLPELEDEGKYKVGKDFYLAFSPERVDPGNKKYNIRNTPKVVGGVTKECRILAERIYQLAIDKVFIVSSTKVAESVKLLENIFRSVNIGLINEMAQLCHRMDMNIWEIIDAASTKPYGFMPFYPGPGLGGHCIPLDPFYLSWKAKAYNFNTRFIELAGEVNGQMPYFVVEIAIDILNSNKKPVNGSNILISGVSYKKDIDDMRESPAIDIIKLLEQKGGKVSYYDPNVPNIELGNKKYRSVKITKEELKKYDIIIIVTDHSNVDYKKIVDTGIPVFDTRNALKGAKGKNIYTF